MSKILVVSTERCGSTNFMKTLELTQNGKFWEHPLFNNFKSPIDKLGVKGFLDKSYKLSGFIGTKIVYKDNDMFIKEVIDYHKHTDQAVRKLNLYDLQKRVIANRKINDRLLNMVDKNSILIYENIKHILVGEKVNTQYTQIENINELNKHYKLNKEFYTYDY